MSKRSSEREQLALFRAQPAEDMALRDAQDLMAYPFFSLAKSRRTVPIRFEAGSVALSLHIKHLAPNGRRHHFQPDVH